MFTKTTAILRPVQIAITQLRSTWEETQKQDFSAKVEQTEREPWAPDRALWMIPCMCLMLRDLKIIFLSPLPTVWFLAAASPPGAIWAPGWASPIWLGALDELTQFAHILCWGEPKARHCIPPWSLECGAGGDNPTPVWIDHAPAASYLLAPAWLLMLQGTSTSHRASLQPPCLPTACQGYLFPQGRNLHCVGAAVMLIYNNNIMIYCKATLLISGSNSLFP